MIYNHRDFWKFGVDAKGLDPAILTIRDEIEYDNGTRIPAFARLTYAGEMSSVHSSLRGAPYPTRPLTEAQQNAHVGMTGGGMGGFTGWTHVDPEGVAHGMITYGHYRPRRVTCSPEGRVAYGD